MPAVKSVRQKHRASTDLVQLLDQFRRMVNVCITVGKQENISSLKALSLRSYYRLTHDMIGYYRLCAISTATAILSNYRNAMRSNPPTRTPYAKNLMLTTCYGMKMHDEHVI